MSLRDADALALICWRATVRARPLHLKSTGIRLGGVVAHTRHPDKLPVWQPCGGSTSTHPEGGAVTVHGYPEVRGGMLIQAGFSVRWRRIKFSPANLIGFLNVDTIRITFTPTASPAAVVNRHCHRCRCRGTDNICYRSSLKQRRYASAVARQRRDIHHDNCYRSATGYTQQSIRPGKLGRDFSLDQHPALRPGYRAGQQAPADTGLNRTANRQHSVRQTRQTLLNEPLPLSVCSWHRQRFR